MRKKHSPTKEFQWKFASEDDTWSLVSSGNFGWDTMRRSHVWRPPTDVLETEETYIVVVEIAGMRGAEFSVTFNRKVLAIHGIRADLSTRKAYHQMEIAYGEFATEVEIQSPIDASRIEATYSDGFLRVVLPKSKPRRISITD
jgi:HSP20 family protein